MTNTISSHDLAALMASETLHAVFDVRERGEFNDGQIANATSLPRSQIEFRITELVPDPKIFIVVYDEGEGRVSLAARTLAECGYENVSALEGGLPSWRKHDFPTASGVNVPSKAFGERVHHESAVPEITPEELKRLQQQSADLLIFDVRTPEEYGRFCIPGGSNIPGGDLILWADVLKKKPESTIVINCAGRTRSIIGTASLMRMGLRNVRALKNGTMGWVLAGLELERMPKLSGAKAPSESREQGRELALRFAAEQKLCWIEPRELIDSSGEAGGCTYILDVRSESEYESGYIPGSLSVPGGQAVQRADDFVAVKNARVVFVSSQSARAVMAAYWYGQMGFRNVRVLRGGLEAWRADGGSVAAGPVKREPLGFERARGMVRNLTPAAINALGKSSDTTLLHVGSSVDFAAAHLPGSRWISRGWLELKLPTLLTDPARPLVLSCADGRSSTLAASALREMAYQEVFVLEGGIENWMRAGYSTTGGLDSCWGDPNDVVLSPSIKGDKEAMRRYLEWETHLTK
jgi:rhodanese-related sulfurtransferase